MAKKQRLSIVDGVLTVEYPTIGKIFKAVLAAYPKDIYIECNSADHGIKQKFGDAESGGTPAEKFAEVQLIHESLLAGDWNRTGTPDLTPMILEAVARIKKVPIAKVQEIAEKVGPDEVKVWGQSPDVKAMRLQILAERARDAAKAPDAKLGKIAGIDA